MKSKRAISDFLSAPSLSAELSEIDEKYAAEMKDKKKQLKKAAGEQHEEEEVVQEAAEPADDAAPEEKILPHMLVGEEATLPIKDDGLQGDKLEKAWLVPLQIIDVWVINKLPSQQFVCQAMKLKEKLSQLKSRPTKGNLALNTWVAMIMTFHLNQLSMIMTFHLIMTLH